MDNIVLGYPLIVIRGEEHFQAPHGAEVFMDEHGVQWIKFVAGNGYNKGREHNMRTDAIYIVNRERTPPAQRGVTEGPAIQATIGDPVPVGRDSGEEG